MATLDAFNFRSQISFLRSLQTNLAQVWPFYLVGPSQSPFPNTILCFISIKCMYNHGKFFFSLPYWAMGPYYTSYMIFLFLQNTKQLEHQCGFIFIKLWCNHTSDYPQEALTKFDYMLEMKIFIKKILPYINKFLDPIVWILWFEKLTFLEIQPYWHIFFLQRLLVKILLPLYRKWVKIHYIKNILSFYFCSKLK